MWWKFYLGAKWGGFVVFSWGENGLELSSGGTLGVIGETMVALVRSWVHW